MMDDTVYDTRAEAVAESLKHIKLNVEKYPRLIRDLTIFNSHHSRLTISTWEAAPAWSCNNEPNDECGFPPK
jgi:hypothetical protein